MGGTQEATLFKASNVQDVGDVKQDPDLKLAGTDLKDLKPVVEKKTKVTTDPVQAVQREQVFGRVKDLFQRLGALLRHSASTCPIIVA